MHLFKPRVVWVLGALCFAALFLDCQAAAEPAQVFKHSPNGQRAYDQHLDAIKDLDKRYREGVAQAGKHFELSAERHVKRYTMSLQRMIRDLTREGKIDLAVATKTQLQNAEAWKIAPPDAAGAHFLSQATLEVKDNSEANKLGVSLLLEIEQLGLDYQKQCDLVFAQHANLVKAARAEYKDALNVVLEREKQAGRLEAVQEVTSVIEALAKPVQVKQPGSEAEVASFVGYYKVSYFDGATPRQQYLIELTEDGGMIHRQSWPKHRGVFREKSNWPISKPLIAGDRLIFSHPLPKDGPLKHEMRLVDGLPVSDIMTGPSGWMRVGRTVERLGTQNKDLLGLTEGVYEMHLTQHTNPFGKKVGQPAIARVEIKNGFFTWTNTNWNNAGYSKQGLPIVMNVEIKGDKLVMQMDPRLRYDTRDHVMEIDMSHYPPKVSHWWYVESYENNHSPHMSGVLRKP